MRAVGVVVALALLLAPVRIPEARAQPDDDRAEIQALLDRRAEAFLERDRATFMATIDPGAHAFRIRQARAWRYSTDVPLESYRLVADWARYGDLARPSDRRRYPDAEAIVIPLTQERYQIRRFDEAEAVEDVYFTFVERDGEWLIGNDTDLDDVGFLSVRHAWDLASLTTIRSDHFLGLGPPCGGSLGSCANESLLAIAEEALARLERSWTRPWNDRVILIVPPSGGALRRMLQATFDPNDFVAFAYFTVDPDELHYSGDRIIVNPAVMARRPHADVLRILAHELLHVATRDVAGPFVPLFVDEGLAEYAGYGGTPGLGYFDAAVAAGLFDGKLPEDFEFSTGTGDDIYLSYQKAQSAVRYFIRRWGLERFTRFYGRLGRARLTPGLATWHVDRTLKKVIGMRLGGFEKAWASSIGG